MFQSKQSTPKPLQQRERQPTACRSHAALTLLVEAPASQVGAAGHYCCCRVNHYLSLVVAENPLEAHREYKRQTQVLLCLCIELYTPLELSTVPDHSSALPSHFRLGHDRLAWQPLFAPVQTKLAPDPDCQTCYEPQGPQQPTSLAKPLTQLLAYCVQLWLTLHSSGVAFCSCHAQFCPMPLGLVPISQGSLHSSL